MSRVTKSFAWLFQTKLQWNSLSEIEREANIARNRALLEQLDLKDATASLGLPPKPAPKPKAKPIQPAKRPKREPVAQPPRRQSARLKREVVDPNETPAQRRKREAEAEKQRIREEEERMAADEQARLAKRPRTHDLELTVLTEAGELNDKEMGALRGTFQAATNAPVPRRIGNVRDWVFDRNDKDEVEVRELRARLEKMKIVARAKVTENRVYSAAYHPEPSKDLIFFGDKHGQLGIWDARAPPDEVADEDGDVTSVDEKEGGKYWRLQQHWPATAKSSISCVKFDPIDSHSVFTTSYDCTVRRLSFVSSISQQVFSSDDILITSIDLPPSGHEMWISDASGALTHYDLREGEKSSRRYQLSDQKIGSPQIIALLWDARKLQTLALGTDVKSPVRTTHSTSSPATRSHSTARSLGPFEYDHDTVQAFKESKAGRGLMRAEFQHGKSASSAYWDPRGRSVVSTSYDDSINLWELDAGKYDSSPVFPSFNPFKRIKHNCQTGKWLTILRAVWNPNPDVYPHFMVGNMQHSLDIFSCKGELIARLADRESAMSLDDIWDAPVESPTEITSKEVASSPLKRPRQTLFFSDSDSDRERPSKRTTFAAAPTPAPAPRHDPEVDALFADIEEGVGDKNADDVEDLRYKPLAPALDLARLAREAEERLARDKRTKMPALTPHQVTSSSPPPQNGPSAKGGDGKGKAGEEGANSERRKPITLNEERLVGPSGFPQLIKDMKGFKPKGKGHEVRLSVWRDEAKGLVNGRKPEDDDADVIDLTERDPKANPPHGDNSEFDEAETKNGMEPSRSSSLPPTSSEPDDDDFDIDAVIKAEEERLAALRAANNENSIPDPASPVSEPLPSKYRERNGTNDMDVDEEALWEGLDNSAAGDLILSQPPKTAEPTTSFDDDEDMWDIVNELEQNEPKQKMKMLEVPISSVVFTATQGDSSTENTSRATNDEDWDE
ncbi:hypothetical protein ID866_4255, partial [Astraeus odoratus]